MLNMEDVITPTEFLNYPLQVNATVRCSSLIQMVPVSNLSSESDYPMTSVVCLSNSTHIRTVPVILQQLFSSTSFTVTYSLIILSFNARESSLEIIVKLILKAILMPGQAFRAPGG